MNQSERLVVKFTIRHYVLDMELSSWPKVTIFFQCKMSPLGCYHCFANQLHSNDEITKIANMEKEQANGERPAAGLQYPDNENVAQAEMNYRCQPLEEDEMN